MDFQTSFDTDTLAEALLVMSTLLASRSVFLNRSDLTESLMKEIHHQLPELRTELFGDAVPNRAEHTTPEGSGEQCETKGDGTSGSAGRKCDTYGEIQAQPVVHGGETAASGQEAKPNAEITPDRSGHFGEIVAAIKYIGQSSLSDTPDEDPEKPNLLSNIGILQSIWFESWGELEDLNVAIDCFAQAVQLTPGGHPLKPTLLNNLGTSHHSRYQRLGKSFDLDKAIEYISQALPDITDNGELSVILCNLGLMYSGRYQSSGELSDLDRALEFKQLAAFIVPEESPEKPMILCNLSVLYRSRYERLGDLGSLDSSIKCLHQGVPLAHYDNPFKPMLLHNLGFSYQARFERLGELTDLETAIDYCSQAVALLRGNCSFKHKWLNNLGLCYVSQFGRLGTLGDLESAIDCITQAVSLIGDEHIDKPTMLSNLSYVYLTRFERFEALSDLDHAIKSGTKAASLVPEGHSAKSMVLSNLGASYQHRFSRLRELSDLNMAINYLTQAVSLTPDDHATKAIFLLNLSDVYCARYEQSDDLGDIRLALAGLEQASGLSTAPPLGRFTSARLWAQISSRHKLPSQLTAYSQAMALIPRVIWLGSATNRRFGLIPSIENVAIEAATVAIELHRYELALEWLEGGRTIIWNQLLQLRTPLEDLAIIDAPLAEKLKQASQRLEQAAAPGLAIPGPDSDQVALEEAAQQHRRLAEHWESLVEQARSLPTMGDFLRSKKASCLVEAARASTVVIITVHKYGCYALIIPSAATKAECISLTDLTYDKVSAARAQLSRSLRAQGRTDRTVTTQPKVGDTIEKVLKMLWTSVAKPVLEFLGYTVLPMRELPRITWCTTGPLSFLPLHAAGDYSKPGCSLYDYAISSFTPTLSALIAPPADPSGFSGILAIGQSHTPGFSPLPGTSNEIDQIGKQIGAIRFTRLEGEKATTSAVLDVLDEYPWVHFACHASQNIDKPTASAFHLHDGPLDLGKITRKQLKHAKMAYLSACQTAVGDEELPDEAVHIAASMIVAGYRTVIGTMWRIDDQDAPLVAERFYTYMLDQNAPCEGKAARALHYAVQHLRTKVGLKEFGRWAPYIHIGI